ncbi:hypothetical protein ACWEKM_16385 [Streptomyces sp. NPDC004752]
MTRNRRFTPGDRVRPRGETDHPEDPVGTVLTPAGSVLTPVATRQFLADLPLADGELYLDEERDLSGAHPEEALGPGGDRVDAGPVEAVGEEQFPGRRQDGGPLPGGPEPRVKGRRIRAGPGKAAALRVRTADPLPARQ